MHKDLKKLKSELKNLKDPAKASSLKRYFKTAAGQYGHGDIFLGISVPAQRKIAKKYSALNLADLRQLLTSKVHEHRFTALEILIAKYRSGNQDSKKAIFNFYLANKDRVNNWDLVDGSARQIVGDYLRTRSVKNRGANIKNGNSNINGQKNILLDLAKSKNLWHRRMAIISTMDFIWHSEFDQALLISELLLTDQHDLIHKAVGWVLREIGKKSISKQQQFLRQHYQSMPRTTLRYAIERFPKKKRLAYLHGKI